MRGKLEIKVLPKRLRDEFFGADTGDWEFGYSKLSKDEIDTLKAFIKETNISPSDIFRIPEVNYPEGIKSPDLLIGNIRVEIKNISSLRSIEDQTSKASKQALNNGMVLYNTKNSKLTDNEIISEIEKRALNKGVFGFFVSNKDKAISLKIKSKNDSATSSYAGIDSESFRNLIIPQRTEKIKSVFNPETPNKYWQKRAEARFEASEKLSNAQIRQIHEIYIDASHKTIAEIKKLYATYYKKDKTFDKFALNSIEPQGNVQRFKTRMAELGLNQYLPDNYDFRATRLEMLNHQIWAELKEIGIKQNNAQTKGIINTINNTYNRTIYDTQKKFSNLSTFSKLDSQTVQEILNHKIDGAHFSNRIWKNTDILAQQIQKKVATAISIGESQEKLIKEIQERFSVGRFYAERLVRTETALYHNIAQLRAYEELGATKYQILATLDKRTSKTCQHQDHKIYEIKKAKVGENYPPFHPLCRTTTVAYFGEDSKSETRFARNPETGKDYQEENISYKDWQKKHNIQPAMPRKTPKMEPEEEVIKVNVKKPPIKKVDNSNIPTIKAPAELKKYITDNEIKQIEDALNNMPNNHRIIWNKFADELELKNNNKKEFYSNNAVNLTIEKTINTEGKRKPLEVFLHEYGHGLDYRANRGSYKSFTAVEKLSNGKTLGETIFKEANARLKSHEGRTKAQRQGNLAIEIVNELKQGFGKYDIMSIFDLYGGAVYTKSRIFFGIGHDHGYWNKTAVGGLKLDKEHRRDFKNNMLGLEGFAEMFSATARMDKKEIELYEKYLPESFKAFNELLERMTKL